MWYRTDKVNAPEGEIVVTLTENGLEQELTRKGNLWYFPDMSMYVYYTPLFWKRMGR